MINFQELIILLQQKESETNCIFGVSVILKHYLKELRSCGNHVTFLCRYDFISGLLMGLLITEFISKDDYETLSGLLDQIEYAPDPLL